MRRSGDRAGAALALIDVRVDDEIPVAVSTPETPDGEGATASPTGEASPAASSPAPPAGPIDLLAGTFISHEHETTGSARIIENPDGTRYLG